MRKLLLFLMMLAGTNSVLGQGALEWGNTPTGFRAPIYGPESFPYSWLSLSGQSNLGIPSGSTVYGGTLLQGTGWTFAVYTGPANAPENTLTLLTSTTFRTATGNVLPAGLVFSGTATVPGVKAGESAEYQIRVWDNRGGTITTWEQVLQASGAILGASQIVNSAPLGGIDSNGTPILTPATTGWASFNVHSRIPEPSTATLIGLGAVAMLTLRRGEVKPLR